MIMARLSFILIQNKLNTLGNTRSLRMKVIDVNRQYVYRGLEPSPRPPYLYQVNYTVINNLLPQL